MTQSGGLDGGNRKVLVTIESDGDNGYVKQQAEGEMFPKGRQYYLRYAEPEDAKMGRTITTIRVEPGQLRVVRHGDVKTEQTFDPGRKHIGYLNVPQGRLELETQTESVEVSGDWTAEKVALTVRWNYRLTVGGQPAGRFRNILKAEYPY